MKNTMNLDTMSLEELQGRLRIFGARGSQLCGRMPDGQPLGLAVKKFFDDLLLSTTDAEKIRQRNEFLARAEADPVTRKQLCGIRVETFNNYILATLNIVSMFFEVVNLGLDERPVMQNTTDQEVSVTYVGQDGGTKMVKVVKDDVETLINLHWLTTDRVRYRRMDIYRGSIVDAALKILRLAYDMSNQMEAKAKAVLDTCYGDFVFTGKKATWTYLANSRIKTANLPSTNDVVVPGTSASTKFRYAVLKAIKKYADQWTGAFVEGPLVPSGRILIPAVQASDIADEIVPSGATNNPVANQLLENGWSTIDYLGMRWTLVTDNTLDPNYCYPEFNRKAGRVYLKPAMDREQVRGDEDYALSQQNEEERWNQKVFGCATNTVLKPNTARFKFKS
jgi:hypothetical protein